MSEMRADVWEQSVQICGSKEVAMAIWCAIPPPELSLATANEIAMKARVQSKPTVLRCLAWFVANNVVKHRRAGWKKTAMLSAPTKECDIELPCNKIREDVWSRFVEIAGENGARALLVVLQALRPNRKAGLARIVEASGLDRQVVRKSLVVLEAADVVTSDGHGWKLVRRVTAPQEDTACTT